jgi:hypothetical protein
MDAPCRELDEHQHVDSFEPHGFDGEKSPAIMLEACWARNWRHVVPPRRGAGPRPRRTSSFLIAVADTLIPSFWSSPWMRLYPHLGFSLARRRISSRMSIGSGGLPGGRLL